MPNDPNQSTQVDPKVISPTPLMSEEEALQQAKDREERLKVKDKVKSTEPVTNTTPGKPIIEHDKDGSQVSWLAPLTMFVGKDLVRLATAVGFLQKEDNRNKFNDASNIPKRFTEIEKQNPLTMTIPTSIQTIDKNSFLNSFLTPTTEPPDATATSEGLKTENIKRREKIREKIQEGLNQVYGNQSWEAVKRGANDILPQNLSLLSGTDIQSDNLTSDDLKQLVKNKYFTPEEALQWQKNRDKTEILENSVSAIGNSLMIMGELQFVGIEGIGWITKDGIKWATAKGFREGMAHYVPQLYRNSIELGKQSWKLFGPGANIRATNETVKELKKRNDAGEKLDWQDYWNTAAKYFVKENISAASEGFSEGMLPELKLGSVGLKKLMKLEGQAWYNLSKNFIKKSTLGTGTETITEQFTDVANDMTDPESRQSAYWILMGETPEVRKGALNNLIVEAVTGEVLGHTMGMNEIFSRKPIEELENLEKKGEITKEELELAKVAIQEPALKDAVANRLKSMSYEKTQTKKSDDIQNGMGLFANVGSNDQPIIKGRTADEYIKGMDAVKSEVTNTRAKVTEQLKDEESTGLEHVLQQGKEESKIFFNATDGNETVQQLEKVHPAYQMNDREIKDFSEASTSAAVIAGTQLGLMKQLDNVFADSKSIPLEQKNAFLADVMTGIANNYGEKGYQIIQSLHPDINTNYAESVIKQAKELQSSITKEQRKVLDDTIKQATSDALQQHIGRKEIEEFSQTEEDNIKNTVNNYFGTSHEDVSEILDAINPNHEYNELDELSNAMLESVISEVNDSLLRPEWMETMEMDRVDLADYRHALMNTPKVFNKLRELGIEKLVQEAAVKQWQNMKQKALLKDLDPSDLTVVKGIFYEFYGRKIGSSYEQLHTEFHRGPSQLNQLDETSLEQRVAMYAPAIKYNDQLYVGAPGQIHADIWTEYNLNDLADKESFVYGFIDAEGKFYNREEAAAATGKPGETVSQGLAEQDVDLFPSTPSVEGTGPKYNDFLGQYQGKKFYEMFAYLDSKQLIPDDLRGLLAWVGQHVGDMETTVEDLGVGIKGKFIDTMHGGPRMVINSMQPIRTDSYDVTRTFLHEALHALTSEFIRNRSEEARYFVHDAAAIIKQVEFVLNNPYLAKQKGLWTGSLEELKQFKKEHNQKLKSIFQLSIPVRDATGKVISVKVVPNIDEFVSGLYADTDIVKYLLSRMPALKAAKPVTKEQHGWRSILQSLKKLWSTIDEKADDTLLDYALHLLERHGGNLADFHTARKGELTVAGARIAREQNNNFTDTAPPDLTTEDVVPLLDENQQEEESIDPDTVVDKMLQESILADLVAINTLDKSNTDVTLEDFIASTKLLPNITSFMEWVDKLDAQSNYAITRKLNTIATKSHSTLPKDIFRDRVLASLFRTARTMERKVVKRLSVNWQFDPSEGKQIAVQRLINESEASQTTKFMKPPIVLESFINTVNEILGLKEDWEKAQIHFLSGFDLYQEGQPKGKQGAKLKTLDNHSLGFDRSDPQPITDNLATLLSSEDIDPDYTYIYVGSFGQRDTLPIIAIPKVDNGAVQVKVNRALEHIRQWYSGTLKLPSSAWKNVSIAMQRGNTLRMVFEELYAGGSFGENENKNIVPVKSEIIGEDLNKLFKRGSKFLIRREKASIDVNKLMERTKGRPLTGIKVDGNEVILNMVMIDPNDDGTITYKLEGDPTETEHTISVVQLIRNELGTSRLDGASIYLIDEFDTIYTEAFGLTKSGTFKNFYSSISGEEPLFIKHAMHGISKNSILGKWMKQNGIAILSTKDAVKLSGKLTNEDGSIQIKHVKFSDYYTPGKTIPDNLIHKLVLSRFDRVKEENSHSTFAGAFKQITNGSGIVESNPVYQEIKKLLHSKYSASDILIELGEKSALLAVQDLKKSLEPDALLDTFVELLENPQGEREQQLANTYGHLKDINKEVLAGDFGNLITVPSVAKALRDRLVKPIDRLLQSFIPGGRSALRFDMGALDQEAGIKPLTELRNQAELLLNDLDDVKSGAILTEMFPERELRSLVSQYRSLQRTEDWMRRKGIKGKRDLQNAREVIMKRINMMGSEMGAEGGERANQLKNAKYISQLIDWTPAVRKYAEEKIWGKQVTKDGKPSLEKGIINPVTGMLNDGWSYLSKSKAIELGLKPGDKLLAVITPTDSPLGIYAVKVAAIVPDYAMSEGAVTFNSEYIQTLVGKDFDIDSISLVPYDASYWSPRSYETLWWSQEKSKAIYKRKTAEVVKKVLDEKGIVPYKENSNQEIPVNEDTVFSSKEVREAYCIALMGPRKAAESTQRSFQLLGKDFQFIDEAYMVDPKAIIGERLQHTALSAINFETTDGTGTKYTVNHDKWFQVHTFHLIDTNFSVDFPGQTSKLAYNSDPRTPEYQKRLFELTFNLPNLDEGAAKSVGAFMHWLIRPALALTKLQDVSASRLDYYELKQQILYVQNILKLLGSNTQLARETLRDLYFKSLDDNLNYLATKISTKSDYYLDRQKAINTRKEFLKPFIENIYVGDIRKYPLFNTLLNFDTTQMMMPGTTYQNWLIDQMNTSFTLFKNHDYLSTIWYEDLLGRDSKDHSKTVKPVEHVQKFTKVPQTATQRIAVNIMKGLGFHQVFRKQGRIWKYRYTQFLPPDWKNQFGEKNSEFAEQWRTLKTDHDKVDYILYNPALLSMLKANAPIAFRDQLEEDIAAFVAIKSTIGKEYPSDFSREDEKGVSNYGVTKYAILLDMLCAQLDYVQGRRDTYDVEKLKHADRGQWLAGIRDEVISLLAARQEMDVTKTRDPKTKEWILAEPSFMVLNNRHGKQVAYPLLMKAILRQSTIKSPFETKETRYKQGSAGQTILLSVPDTFNAEKPIEVELRLGSNGLLYITHEGETWTHVELFKAAQLHPESSQGLIYRLLTERNGFWEGIENPTDNKNERQGTKNRLELNKILRLSDSINIYNRISILKLFLKEELYGNRRRHKFNRSDIEGFWISLMGQAGDAGIRDQRGQNLIINRREWTDKRPLDFSSNEIMHELLSYFEPDLFNAYMQEYNRQVKNTVNVRKLESIQNALAKDFIESSADMMDVDFNEVDENYSLTDPTKQSENIQKQTYGKFAPKPVLNKESLSARQVLELFQSDIQSLRELADTKKDFMKLIKGKDGYAEGVKALEAWSKSIRMARGLNFFRAPLNQVIKDLKQLSNKDFDAKYSKIDPIKLASALETIRTTNDELATLKEAIKAPSVAELRMGKNIGRLYTTYKKFRAIAKSLDKVNSKLDKAWIKSKTALSTYDVHGPMNERKLMILNPADTQAVGYTFHPTKGAVVFTAKELINSQRLVPTFNWDAYGLSTLAIAKSRAIDTELLKVQSEFESHVITHDTILKLLIDPKLRTSWLDAVHLTNDPLTQELRKAIEEWDPQGVNINDIALLRETVWDLAENLSKTRRKGGEHLRFKNGVILDMSTALHKSGRGALEYKNIAHLIRNKYYNLSGQDRIIIMAALQLRELFDVKVPTLMNSVYNYINQSIAEAYNRHDAESLGQLTALRERYKQYLKSIEAMNGAYLPHAFPVSFHRARFYKQYEQDVKEALDSDIRYHNALAKENNPKANPKLAEIDLDDIARRKIGYVNPDPVLEAEGKRKYKVYQQLWYSKLQHKFNELQVGNAGTYVITNFLKRKLEDADDYIKDNPKVFFDYINRLIQGVTNDLKYSDWLLYQANARLQGETPAMIEYTKMWYANQIDNRILQSKDIEIQKLKKGMQIHFLQNKLTMNEHLHTVESGEQVVWGTVEKVDLEKGEIHLFVDETNMRVQTENQIRKLKRRIAKMEASGFEDIDMEALGEGIQEMIQAQPTDYYLIRTLLENGYLSDEDAQRKDWAEMTQLDAAKLIYKGMINRLTKIGEAGIYKISDIYTKDFDGNIVNTKVKRYLRPGSIEYLSNKAREYHNNLEMDGEWGNKMDKWRYYGFKIADRITSIAAELQVTAIGLAYLGVVAAPRAFITNLVGAQLNNRIDAPWYNSKLIKRAHKEADKYMNLRPEQIAALSSSEREWRNLLAGMGFLNKENRSALALSAGNLEISRSLEKEGFFKELARLFVAAKAGIPYMKYLKELSKLQKESMLNTDSTKDDDIRIRTFKLMKEFENKTEEALKNKGAFSRMAQKERSTPFNALKLAATLSRDRFLASRYGLGLQGVAERERMPAFYIGYFTAKDQGHDEAEAIWLGLNAVKLRHAYYGKPFRMTASHTKLGKVLTQYTQYQNNSFLTGMQLWKEGIAQLQEHWINAGLSKGHPFYKLMKRSEIVWKRTFKLVDANLQTISQQRDPQKQLEETNVMRLVMLKTLISMMIFNAGVRIFNGIQNMTDPFMGQWMYRLVNVIASSFYTAPDDDDDEELKQSFEQWLRDTLFQIGVTPKLLSGLIINSDQEDIPTLIMRGRPDSQLQILYKTWNTIIGLLNNTLEADIEKPHLNLSDWSEMLDKMVLGINITGYSPPGGGGGSYPQQGLFLDVDIEDFPSLVTLEERERIVKAQRRRWVQTYGEGIAPADRPSYVISPKTWVPFLDMMSDYNFTPPWDR